MFKSKKALFFILASLTLGFGIFLIDSYFGSEYSGRSINGLKALLGIFLLCVAYIGFSLVFNQEKLKKLKQNYKTEKEKHTKNK